MLIIPPLMVMTEFSEKIESHSLFKMGSSINQENTRKLFCRPPEYHLVASTH